MPSTHTMLPSEKELYQERYLAELDRRSYTNDRFDSMVNVLALLVGVLLFLLNYTDMHKAWCRWMYWTLLILAIAFLATAAVWIYHLFMSDQAAYLPDPKEYRDYHKRLLFAHQGKIEVVDQIIREQIVEDYLEAAQFNATKNDLRDRSMRKIKKLFSIALLAMIMASIPLSIEYFGRSGAKENPDGRAPETPAGTLPR